MRIIPALALLTMASLRADDVVRVGLIQMDGRTFDKEYNLARAEKGNREAAARGAKLLSTPEVAVQGYPRAKLPVGASFDDPKLVAERAKILAAAEPIPGPATHHFCRLARELGVWLVSVSPGHFSGGIHQHGWMLASGVHHGDGFPVWEVEIAGVKTKVGIQICYDIQHPESTRELALGGAEVVLSPYCTNDFARPLLVHLFQTRALDGSAIFDFEGSTQAELDEREGVLVGDLNLTALRKIRSAWNKVYGPENRYPAAYKRLRQE